MEIIKPLFSRHPSTKCPINVLIFRRYKNSKNAVTSYYEFLTKYLLYYMAIPSVQQVSNLYMIVLL